MKKGQNSRYEKEYFQPINKQGWDSFMKEQPNYKKRALARKKKKKK